MLSGFNTNFRYRGALFHVQTEDSGLANPHLITHLYYEGTILASEKQSYAARSEDPNLSDLVKELMEQQHLGMLNRLRSGVLDAEIEERVGAIFREAPKAAREGDTEPALTPNLSRSGTPAAPTASALTQDAPLDELVLEYLNERATRPQSAR